ncbi:MAG TPA: amidohydrolase family protein [Caulobacteraceae bacterium]|nr:amidohydrolase family protein [Caulobacteraceae bacterium]
MFDLLIKNGTIIDGTGGPAYRGDVAVIGDTIVEVGKVLGAALRVIDAEGRLVTPGWVDIHTHYDGQATWDDQLAPSFWHGVTTVVMGNCGVGFAPVAPAKRDWLIQVMEGVEDIPGSALAEGIKWEWETFPEFMGALSKKSYALNVGAQVPHAAVRSYVMGERGAANEPATQDDLERIGAAVTEGIEAGAFGFTTTRSTMHRALDGSRVPGSLAAAEELHTIASAVGRAGRGLIGVAPAGLSGDDLIAPAREIAWMNEVSSRYGVPVTFLCLQNGNQPDWWREQLAECRRQRANGARVMPQVYSRAVGAVITLENKINPFRASPTMRELERYPLAERAQRLREDPALRARVVEEGVHGQFREGEQYKKLFENAWENIYPSIGHINYEPDAEGSIAAIARREDRDPRDVALSALLEDNGRGMLLHQMAGYSNGSLDPQHEMLSDPDTIIGGGDGGAHVGVICDSGVPTFMLTYWARDRQRGERLPLEFVIRKQTSATARAFGILDRGELKAGFKADINIIDYDRLQFETPFLTNDLPTGAARLMQKARGYEATFVNGVQIQADGEDTGARPARLLRSQPAAAFA